MRTPVKGGWNGALGGLVQHRVTRFGLDDASPTFRTDGVRHFILWLDSGMVDHYHPVKVHCKSVPR